MSFWHRRSASALGVALMFAASQPAHAPPWRGGEIAQTGRAKRIFNADWRFRLGATDGAEAPAFDDSGWEAVGLPHRFSQPYFRAAAFYTATAGIGRRPP